MIRFLTLVAAVWLVSVEVCYGEGPDCNYYPPKTYKGKEYAFDVETCFLKLENVPSREKMISNLQPIKLYGSNCSDESRYYEMINLTHMKETIVNSYGEESSKILSIAEDTEDIEAVFFFIGNYACYSSYVNQVSMSERCSIQEPSIWDYNSTSIEEYEEFVSILYNRIDCSLSSSLPPKSEEKDESFPLWAILVLSIGGAIFLGMAAYFLIKKGKANVGGQIERVPKGSLLF